MIKIVDLLSIILILSFASYRLIKIFNKAKANCGSLCSGCSGTCKPHIKQFKAINIIKIND